MNGWYVDIDATANVAVDSEILWKVGDAVHKHSGAAAGHVDGRLSISIWVQGDTVSDAAVAAEAILNEVLSSIGIQAAVTSLRVLDEATRTRENNDPADRH